MLPTASPHSARARASFCCGVCERTALVFPPRTHRNTNRNRGEHWTRAHGHTDHTDEPHNHPNPPTHGRWSRGQRVTAHTETPWPARSREATGTSLATAVAATALTAVALAAAALATPAIAVAAATLAAVTAVGTKEYGTGTGKKKDTGGSRERDTHTGHTGHTGARGHTDHTDEPHNHPPKPNDTPARSRDGRTRGRLNSRKNSRKPGVDRSPRPTTGTILVPFLKDSVTVVAFESTLRGGLGIRD